MLYRFALGFALLALSIAPAQARDDRVAQAQLLLKMIGYDAGAIDGSYGGKTKQAFDAFYAARGGSFDGNLSDNEFDDLYDALKKTPFNGVTDIDWIDPKVGRTGYAGSDLYDFIPSTDLTEGLPKLSAFPVDPLSTRLAALDPKSFNKACSYVPLDGFPEPGKLTTYPSFKAFQAANRTPHPGNGWFEQVSFASQRAASDVHSDEAAADFRQALLAYSAGGAGLDSANLLDKSGKVVVTSDFGAQVMNTTAVTANYIIARPRLGLSSDERNQIEEWLNRLYENFPDSMLLLNGKNSSLDPRTVHLIGRAMLVNGILNEDAVKFNEGARLVAVALSFVRDDGSDRFGASRGFRAMYYQGVALMDAMEDLIILQAYLPGSFDHLRPTADRLAEFLSRAWFDHAVIFPYAKENEAVTPGSNYKKQESRNPSFGLDPYLSISSDKPYFAALLKMRGEYEFERMFSQTFNSTCLGLTLPDAILPEQPLPEGVGHFDVQFVTVRTSSADENGTYFWLALGGTTVDGEIVQIPPVNVITDWNESRPTSLGGFRLGLGKSELIDDQTRNADFTVCDDVAYSGSDRFNLQIGFEEEVNTCVLDKLGPTDRHTLMSLMYNFDAVIEKIPQSGRGEKLRQIYELVP